LRAWRHLPPGIAKRYPAKPAVQQCRPTGLPVVVVDNDACWIVAATGLIADILSDVL
jgi:hypothetical protein